MSLHELALECVAQYKHSEKELISVLSQIDRTREYFQVGVPSLFRYCVEKLGLSEAETYRFTQVTRKCEEVPALKKAIQDGLLTVSKASRIAPVITKANQDNWIQKAVTSTQREIEKEIAKSKPEILRKETLIAKSPSLYELRLQVSYGLESKLRRLQVVLGKTTLEETLEAMADVTLFHRDPLEKAKRSAKKHELAPTLRQAAVTTTNYQNRGKQLRSPIPSALRHQLYIRDQGRCGYKHRGEKRWLHIHHVQPLALGGRNRLENLMLVCSAHHAMIHRKSGGP